MKVSAKRCDQLHIFFAVQTIFNFWWDLESFDKKVWPFTHFFRCGDYLKFLRGLGKIFDKKMCAQLHISVAVQTILSFWWDLESFGKKMWPVTHFFRSADYLKFLMGLGKFRQKGVTSYTFFSQVSDYLKFLMGLSYSFDKKVWRSADVIRCGDYLKCLRGLGKFRQRDVTSYTFFCSADYLKFLMGLWKFRQNDVTSYTFFPQCRLSYIFDGTWKVSTTRCDFSYTFFAVETILSFWGDLESFDKKMCPVTRFFRCGD